MIIIRPPEKTPLCGQLEVLLPRLNEQSPHYHPLHQLLGRETAGYYGETSLNYYLHLVETPDKLILYGLRLPGQHNAFQIDALLITAHCCIIIEAKNFKGEITFNPAGQMIRKIDDTAEVYTNPEIQANEQKRHLQHFLLANGFPALPIYALVSFTHPKVILQFEQHYDDILTNEQLPLRIRQLIQSNTSTYSKVQLKKLANVLMKQHHPHTFSVIEKYNIPSDHIQKGVLCTGCSKEMMKRQHGSWYCFACSEKNPNAHIQALISYALLYGSWATNGKAREFLNLESPSSMQRIFKKLQLDHQGEHRGRKYDLSSLVKMKKR